MTTIAAHAVGVPDAAARRETAIARTALALVGLHVLDDSFLQPQPGTSAADHLPGGLVQLALLSATAAFYPRLRAGLWALLALVIGFFAAVGGAGEAGYYTVKVGPSGDDYILMIVAGVVLLGVGAVMIAFFDQALHGPRIATRLGGSECPSCYE